VYARHLLLLVTAASEIERVTYDAFGRTTRNSYRCDLTAGDRIRFSRVSILGVFADHDIIDFVRIPNLDQRAMNFVLDARVQFHRADIGVEIELLSIENYLSESRQLWLGIWLAWLGENGFSVNLVTNGAEQNGVSRLAFFKRTLGPFGLMFDIVMAPAGNLLDLEIDLKQLAGQAQNAQRRRQNLGPDSITGQRYDVIGLFRHYFCSRRFDYKRLAKG